MTPHARNPKLARVNGNLNRWSVVGLAAAVLSVAGVARGGDLVTLSGAVYHDAEMIHVDPDGVTYQYDEGQCKLDFTDLPPSVRQAYHYDAAKAAAYRDAQTKGQQEADAKRQALVQEGEERHHARMQAEAAAVLSRVSGSAEMVYRRSQSAAASDATKALGAQMAAAVGKKEKGAAPASATIVELRKIESTLTDLGIIHFSHQAEVLNPDEFKTNLHHAPGGFDATGVRDAFSEPIYLTKSYYEDVDRSAALLSNEPLKP